ncbi:hypothetical protein PIROE2DRAFT_65238 [Piromyces sp. E2]|nr:hypothetical protein PIROE2DRAFT_65238 [Piromyces sp. E2]|eukprot:OUM57027.1 hypothetical protein PIROE2DRAFT_65238 [Piromyces sp. E2]
MREKKSIKNKINENIEIEEDDKTINKEEETKNIKSSKKGNRSTKGKTEKIEDDITTNKQHDTVEVNRKRKNNEINESDDNLKSAKKSKINIGIDEEENVDIPRIIFTGIDDHYVNIVKDLGGIVEESWENCTHLVTDKIRRTVKFLCVLATGKKIVSLNWVKASKKAGKFLDPNKYILKDPASEKKWKFTMKSSLKTAHDNRDNPLFKGLTFYMTPNTKPPFDEMETIINAAGGTLIKDLPEEVDNDIVILSCPDDSSVCKSLVKQGYDNIHSNEFILSGILKQSVDYKSYKMKFENTTKSHSTSGGRKRKR